MSRRGGVIFIKVNSMQLDAKGGWTYNHGSPMREAIVGADAVHGYSEKPQVPFCEGAITDSPDLDLAALKNTKDATVTMELANGKTFVLRGAWFAGEGSVTTEEGEVAVRFEGLQGEEF